MTTPTIIEETWWEVTYPTGSILALPAPLTSIDDAKVSAVDPAKAMTYAKTNIQNRVVSSHSVITGRSYAVDLADAVYISVRQVKSDPERMQRAIAKAAGLSSETSSPSGPTRGSRSDDQESRSGRSTGALIKRPTHH